jgi:hypothetical protein
LGVSAEKVVATMDTPSNHHGILLPPRKYSALFLPAVFETASPMTIVRIKNNAITIQSKVAKCMMVVLKMIQYG